jgi:hypothetical protein
MPYDPAIRGAPPLVVRDHGGRRCGVVVRDHGAGFLSRARPRPLGGGLLLLDGCFGGGRVVENHCKAPLVHDDHPSANEFFSSLGTALTET